MKQGALKIFICLLVICLSPSVFAQAEEEIFEETPENQTFLDDGKGISDEIIAPKFSRKQEERMEQTRAILMDGALAGDMPNETLKRAADEVINYIVFSSPRVFPSQIPTLFFTSEELEQIINYENGTVAAEPTEVEVDTAREDLSQFKVGSGAKNVSLAGILYVSSKDWIIWLNGQKMTPKRLAPEIVNIKVNENFILVDWYDSDSNQIYPIKLKPHQRFNLESRIFLPG